MYDILQLNEMLVPELRDIAEQMGAVLIFDEVMTGFRLAAGDSRRLHAGAARRSGHFLLGLVHRRIVLTGRLWCPLSFLPDGFALEPLGNQKRGGRP